MQQLLNSIRNIYCVGRNYKLHAAELGNTVPTEPMLFMKPTHALAQMDGSKVVLPNSKGSIHYEAEMVIHIGKSFQKGMKVEEVVEHISLGIDFTLRDLQSQIKAEGLPWLPAKGFRNSALIGSFVPINSLQKPLSQLQFSLVKNGETVQKGNVEDMIFSLQQIVDFCSDNYGVGAGDLIYTGTPAGVGAVADGDRLLLMLGDQPIGESIIQLHA